MKNIKLILITFLSLFLVACSNSDNTENSLPTSDIIELSRQEIEESILEQPLENISKITFYHTERNAIGDNRFAIDLGNDGIYIDPSMPMRRSEEFDADLTDEDEAQILNILEENNVDKWNQLYIVGNKETIDELGGGGYHWYLGFQYKDSSAYYKKGEGTKPERVYPAEYENFIEDMNEFIDNKEAQVN